MKSSRIGSVSILDGATINVQGDAIVNMLNFGGTPIGQLAFDAPLTQNASITFTNDVGVCVCAGEKTPSEWAGIIGNMDALRTPEGSNKVVQINDQGLCIAAVESN